MGIDKMINAQKIVEFQSAKRNANKLLSKINNKDIAEDIQYSDENVLLNVYHEALKAANDSVAKIDKNGDIVTFREQKEKLKSEKENTSAGLLLLGFIPGLIIFLIVWGRRKSKYTSMEEKTREATETAMASFLIAQPELMESFKKNIDKFPSSENKKMISRAIAKAEELVSKPSGNIVQIRNILTKSITSKMTSKAENALLEDIVNGTYDKKKIAELINNSELKIFGEGKEGKEILQTVAKLHNSLMEGDEREKNKMLISGIETTRDIAKTNTPDNKKEEQLIKS